MMARDRNNGRRILMKPAAISLRTISFSKRLRKTGGRWAGQPLDWFLTPLLALYTAIFLPRLDGDGAAK